MPRRNKRKIDNAREKAILITDGNDGGKPECAGCAFVGKNLICTTSDGKCLKTREAGNAVSKR